MSPLSSLTFWALMGLSIFIIRSLIRSWTNKSQRYPLIMQALLLVIPPLLLIARWVWSSLWDPFIFYPPWTNQFISLHKILVLSWLPILVYLLFIKRPSIFFASSPGLLISATVLILVPLSLFEMSIWSLVGHNHYRWTIQSESPDKLNQAFLSMRKGLVDSQYGLYVRPRGALLPTINVYSRKLPPDCYDFSLEAAQRALHWSVDSRFLWVDSPECFFSYDFLSKRILRREEFLQAVGARSNF